MLFAKSGQIGTLNKITFARNLFCKWLCNKNLSNTHTFIGPLLSLWEEYISLFRKDPKLARKNANFFVNKARQISVMMLTKTPEKVQNTVKCPLFLAVVLYLLYLRMENLEKS